MLKNAWGIFEKMLLLRPIGTSLPFTEDTPFLGNLC